MNDEPNLPQADGPKPADAPRPLSFATNPVVQVSQPQSPLDQLRERSRWLQYAGAALIILSLPLTWWSLTKYRIYEQRGVDLGSEEQRNAITKDMDAEELKDYEERLGAYTRAWTLNLGLYEHTFYYPYLGEDYANRLNLEIMASHRSATLGLRGWSTWTGWFGLVFVILLFVAQYAPKFSEDLEPIAWAFPLALAVMFGFFTIMTLMYYFGVPDRNGDGVAQGVGLGNYIAILGGLLATTGSVFEGLKSMNARLAELAADEDDEEVEADAAEATAEEKPKPKPKPRRDEPPPRQKSRLEDW